jgi:hypothetical protein
MEVVLLMCGAVAEVLKIELLLAKLALIVTMVHKC